MSRDIEIALSRLSRFLDRSEHQWLAEADLPAIAEFRQGIEKSARISAHPVQPRDSRLDLARLLENLRKAADAIDRGLSILGRPDPKISIEDLLALMFHTVAIVMETPGPGTWRGSAPGETDAA